MIGEGAGGLQCVLGADARHACHTTRAPSHARSRRNRAAAQSARLAAICKSVRIIEGAWLAAEECKQVVIYNTCVTVGIDPKRTAFKEIFLRAQGPYAQRGEPAEDR